MPYVKGKESDSKGYVGCQGLGVGKGVTYKRAQWNIFGDGKVLYHSYGDSYHS